MKILHLVQKPQLRGAEIFASQLSTHLRDNGYEAVIVSLFPGGSVLPYSGKVITLNSSSRHRFWNVGAWRRLHRIIQEEKPDIVQANAGFTLKFAVFSKILFRWKQPIVFRNASTISLYIKSSAARLWNRLFFKYAARIISVSRNTAMDFVQLFPEYHKKVCAIPVGINEYPFGTLQQETKEGPVIIHVGGFTFEKNHAGLIDIFERLLQDVPNAKLWMAGDGPLKKEIEARCRNRGLENNVRFLGFCNNVMPLIRSADVLVLPSIIEGLPAAILEAFYCGVPVVAYDVGGISEIVKPGVTGWIPELHDESGFVSAIREALEKNQQVDTIVENARRLVAKRYLNKSITEEFVHVYHSILHHEENPVHQLN